MLTTSRIKLILLWIFIPILLATLWSLSNNNKDTQQKLTLYYSKSDNTTLTRQEQQESVELIEMIEPFQPVLKIASITSIRLPEPVEIVPEQIMVTESVIHRPIVSNADAEQIRCMAQNIYHEAGGESYEGQVAVARVVMNRVNHGFAANPCRVIYQTSKRVDPATDKQFIQCQFSWVCQGKVLPNTNNDRYRTAKEIAELVIMENKWNDTFHPDVLFFHNLTVNPRWPYTREFKIGNHIFYSKQNRIKNENTRNTRPIESASN
jgi:N-acetylmuramoyl-L-alanine amidase